MAVTFENLVKEEFGREFFIQWKNGGNTSCVINHKNNPDELTACCCPGCVQKLSYTITLDKSAGVPRVSWVDNIAGSFNRMQGNMAAGSGNYSQISAVQKANNLIVQSCSRIESRLLVAQNTIATTSAVAETVHLAPPPQVKAEVMEERDSLADEIAKLKKLHEDGVLTEEEFKEAKQKAISS
mmetsp:Transcript_21207/g.26758  ORF Transcript_21207/g.26758 Transcript_21207/m.26758 type:complete len:183 (+) Transcript_21207:94-642(+)